MRIPRPSLSDACHGAMVVFVVGVLMGVWCGGCAPWWGCKGDDCLGARQAAWSKAHPDGGAR